jgi:hypothetical protein
MLTHSGLTQSFLFIDQTGKSSLSHIQNICLVSCFQGFITLLKSRIQFFFEFQNSSLGVAYHEEHLILVTFFLKSSSLSFHISFFSNSVNINQSV